MSRQARRTAAFSFAAATLVAVGIWSGTFLSSSAATPQVLTGTVGIVGAGGDEFAVLLSGTDQPESYGLSDSIPWRDPQGGWNFSVGAPIPCMKPLSHGQKITFGLVNANPVEDAPGGSVVVWVECPSS
jgi:hypothetical protein